MRTFNHLDTGVSLSTLAFGFGTEGGESGGVAPADPAPAAPAPLLDGDPAPADPAPLLDGDPAPVDPAPKEGDDAPKEGDDAPVEYDFKFGEDTIVDEDAVGELKTLATELKLSAEDAQKFAGMAEKMSTKWASQLQDAITSERLGWREASVADAEFGGDKLNENLAVAKQGRDLFGNDALKELLDTSGIGDHPEMIRLFYNIGKANSEHGFVKTGKPTPQKSFYDHPTSKPKE